MRSISFTLLGIALASVSVGAVAQTSSPPVSTLSFNGAASDYRYRGISQTSFKSALQAGVDYAHKSGLYVGAWASNVSWIKDYVGATDGSTEVDFYGGYKGEITKDVAWILAQSYQYPGNTADKVLANANTTEVYAALTVGVVTAKYSQSSSNFMANPTARAVATWNWLPRWIWATATRSRPTSVVKPSRIKRITLATTPTMQ